MIRRPPLTLWLYILWDLWRLVLLTAAVLVTVISFAAAIKPLADGKLGPIDTIRFMLLAMPPMLQYALPFAACFGATLAYHRLAADNETIAAHAGGISHRTLLVPAAASGLVLALLLLVLSNRIIPGFLRQMSELVSQDISKYIVHQIKSGEAVPLGSDKRRFLFADDVVERGPDEATGAFQRLWLGGLLLVKIDKQGKVEEQASAREATVWLRRVDSNNDEAEAAGPGPMTEVMIRPRDAVFQRKDKRGEIGLTIQPFLVPNSFTDDPKYLSDAELRGLKSKPERIQDVDRRRRELALTLAQLQAVETIREALRGPGHRVEFVDSLGQRVVLKGWDIRPRRMSAAGPNGRGPLEMTRLQVFAERKGQPIAIERTLNDGTVQSQLATTAEIRLPKASSAAAAGPTLGGAGGAGGMNQPNTNAARVAITLQLLEVSAQDLDENGELLAPIYDETGSEVRAAPGVIKDWSLSDLSLPKDPAKSLLETDTRTLMSQAEARQKARGAERDTIERVRADLGRQVDDLMREVLSKQQERLAMTAACFVMIMVGAVMAMRLRDSLPLTIYLWAFFPALAAVITISAGQRMTHGSGMGGLPLLWAGVAALGLYGVYEFSRLVKH